jgi:hypothetical protein
MLELAVGAFLAVEFEACLSEFLDEIADLFGHLASEWGGDYWEF